MPVSGSNGYRSGIVTLPNRVRIREMDSRQWMYPTIARIGDATRSGNLNIPEFDDTQTIIFKEGVSNLLLGSLLESGSTRSLLPYATPNNPTGSITGTGNVISGISDNFYMSDYKELTSRNHEAESAPENLGFFDDSRVNLSDSVFYMTGTNENVYPGFSSRLHDKTQIVINITPSEETEVGFINEMTDADPVNDAVTMQPHMCYYNFDDGKWTNLHYGVRHAGSDDTSAPHQAIVQSGSIGFGTLLPVFTGSDSAQSTHNLYDDDYYASFHRPVDSFGFPFAMKYHATSSCTIKMKDYINKPFLLEKIVFDVAVKLDSPKASESSGGTPKRGLALYGMPLAKDNTTYKAFQTQVPFRYFQHTFFLMRQFKEKSGTTKNFNFEKVYGSSGVYEYTETIDDNLARTNYLDGIFQNASNLEDFNKNRELITYGQSTLIISGGHSASTAYATPAHIPMSSITNSSLVRDELILIESNSSQDNISLSFTGSFNIEANVRLTEVVDRISSFSVSTTSRDIMRSQTGGRMFSDIEAGRSIVNGVPNTKPGKSFDVVLRTAEPPETVVFPDASTIDRHSPYLIFPEDELILGYQFPLSFNFRNNNFALGDAKTNRTRFSKHKPSKITLFGSLIKENKEYHDTLNQTLTSEAVHEVVQYDTPALDQFLIESRNQYLGSYLDNHTTGSVGSVVESLISAGENVLSGSLQRFINIKNPLLRYYDTVLPDITEMVRIDGFEPAKASLLGVKDAEWFLASFLNSAVGNHVHTFWNKIFPFESRYNTINRQIDQSFYLYQITSQNSTTLSLETRSNASFIGTDKPTSVGDTRNIFANSTFIAFTFGKGPENLHRHINSSTRLHRPAGYKYGIMNALPQFSKNIFRYDKFGQYADMLEQGKETRFFLGRGAITQGALDIKFVADDDENDQYIMLNEDEITSNTFESSNLSIYATSSLPFFDDTTPRNRSYNNIQFSNRIIDIVGFEI